MNLVREYLSSIEGVEVYAILAMLLFILAFVVMIIHVFSMRKKELGEFSRLPLEDDQESQKTNE
jgi:cbb3-type cytochrome oxidase subunit 3